MCLCAKVGVGSPVQAQPGVPGMGAICGLVLGAQEGIFPALAGTCSCSDGAVGPGGTVLECGLQSPALWAGPDAPGLLLLRQRVQGCVGRERLQNAPGLQLTQK